MKKKIVLILSILLFTACTVKPSAPVVCEKEIIYGFPHTKTYNIYITDNIEKWPLVVSKAEYDDITLGDTIRRNTDLYKKF